MTNDIAEPKMRPAPLLIGSVLYFALRVPFLNYHQIDLDEGISALIANGPLTEVFARTASMDTNAPLFYLLLTPLRHLTSEVWILRLLPLLAGFACLIAVARIARKIGGERAELCAVLLYSLSAFTLEFALRLRCFSLMGTAFLWALVLALQWWEAGAAASRRTMLGYTLLMIALLYSFYLGAAFWGITALLGLWMLPSGARVRWITANALAGLAFLPWVPVIGQQHLQWTANFPASAPIHTASLPMLLVQSLAELPRGPFANLDPKLGLLVLVGAITLPLWIKREDDSAPRREVLALVLIAGGGFSVMALALAFAGLTVQVRYLYLVLPLCFALMGLGCARLALGGIVLLAVLLLLGLGGLKPWLNQPRDDFKSAAILLQSYHHAPDDPVLVIARYATILLEFHWPEGASRMHGLRVFDPTSPVDQSQLDEWTSGHSRVFVVRSNDASDRWGGVDRGGGALVETLTLRYGPPEETRFEGVRVYRFERH